MYPAITCCRRKWSASSESFLSARHRIFSCGVIRWRRSFASSSFSRVTNWLRGIFTSPPAPSPFWRGGIGLFAYCSLTLLRPLHHLGGRVRGIGRILNRAQNSALYSDAIGRDFGYRVRITSAGSHGVADERNRGGYDPLTIADLNCPARAAADLPAPAAGDLARTRPRLAIVVPCFNEELVIRETARRLVSVLRELREKGQIASDSFLFFVDDGSIDSTWRVLCELNRSERE